MQQEIIKPQPGVTTEHYFGGCPICGGQDGYMNIGAEHWTVCDEHKTKWRIGADLFSCWGDETEETWKANLAELEYYLLAEPVHEIPSAA